MAYAILASLLWNAFALGMGLALADAFLSTLETDGPCYLAQNPTMQEPEPPLYSITSPYPSNVLCQVSHSSLNSHAMPLHLQWH